MDDRTGLDRIFGRMPVLAALKQGEKLERVYIQDSISGPFEIEIRQLCRDTGTPLSRIPRSKLDREIKGNHQGIYALGALVSYEDLEPLITKIARENEIPILLLLDGINDVRNLGAIARSAEIFGAHGIVIPSKGGAPINEIALKSSAGALLHIPVCRVKSILGIMDLLCRQGIEICAADQNSSQHLSDLELKGPVAIVLGEEGKGISKSLRTYADHEFSIPQVGKTESLNVSVAAGIVLYEIYQQRK